MFINKQKFRYFSGLYNNIKYKMSDDYCVYARNILNRIDALSSPSTGFTSSITNTTRNST